MELREIIRADKDVNDWGRWQAGARMPKPAFPLSRSKGRFYRLGAYRWRIVRFTALAAEFRVLIAYHPDKQQYRAVLALERDGDMTVLAQYEYHGTHPGWHVLATCSEVDSAPVGVMRNPWQRRLPRARHFHRNTAFGISGDDQALDRAAAFFRLHRKEGNLV